MSERGFTLIEVVLAAAVVMVVVIATTSTAGTVAGASAGAHGREAAEQAVAATLEQLRALPFASDGDAGADVVSAVFPHADPSRDTVVAYYAPDPRAGRPAGTFFTITTTGFGTLTVAATFVAGGAWGFAPVAVSRLAGYDARSARVLPAQALLVRVTADWLAGQRRGAVARSAVVADRTGGVCQVGAPPTPAP